MASIAFKNGSNWVNLTAADLGAVGSASIIDIAHGGTGSTTAASARSALGLGTASIKGSLDSYTSGSSWSGGTALPTTGAVSDFTAASCAAKSHTHAASDVTSGTFSADRIPGLNASKIVEGTIDIARLPAAALERLKVVANQTARFALTVADVQLGDTVKQMDTGAMYYVVDTDNLGSEDGYVEYTASSAASVPWSGVTGKPSTYAPSAHYHATSDITNFPTSLKNPNALAIYFNGTSQGTYDGSAAKTINITPASIGAIAVGASVSSATTASKLGSSTVGGTATPIYLSAGSPVACSSTVGSETVPVYMSNGAITACTYRIGSLLVDNVYPISDITYRPVFIPTAVGAGWTSSTFQSQGFHYLYSKATSTTSPAYCALALGTGNSSTSGTSYNIVGRLCLYGSSSGYTNYAGFNNSTTNYTRYLVGTTAAGTAVGSTTQPVYVDSTGAIQACTSYANATVGTATMATKLSSSRSINGTYFNGSADIVTAKWGTGRAITLGNTAKVIDGSQNVSWTLTEIGAASTDHTHSTYLPLTGGTLTGNLIAKAQMYTQSTSLALTNAAPTSGTSYGNGYLLRDANGTNVGSFTWRRSSADNVDTYIQCQRTVNSSTYYNILSCRITSSGTYAYTITSPTQFRIALGFGGSTGVLPVTYGGTGATAAGTTLLSNIGIKSGTAAVPSSGVAGTIYIQYSA